MPSRSPCGACPNPRWGTTAPRGHDPHVAEVAPRSHQPTRPPDQPTAPVCSSTPTHVASHAVVVRRSHRPVSDQPNAPGRLRPTRFAHMLRGNPAERGRPNWSGANPPKVGRQPPSSHLRSGTQSWNLPKEKVRGMRRSSLALTGAVITAAASLAFGAGTAGAGPDQPGGRGVSSVHGECGVVVGAEPTSARTGSSAAYAVQRRAGRL